MSHGKKILAFYTCLLAFFVAFAQESSTPQFSIFSDYNAETALEEIKAAVIAHDIVKVKKLYKKQEKAAKLGLVQAQYVLSECCLNGWGTGRNYKKAFEYLKKPAEQDFAEAQCSLAWCYATGYGTTKDYDQAFAWFKKAAEQGNANAQCSLACCYANGWGTKQDYIQAFTWYKKASEQGIFGVQCKLGYRYYKNVTYITNDNIEKGIYLTEDYAQTFTWFTKLAEHGNAEGQVALGNCYYFGLGGSTDKEQARYWYKKAAAQSDKSAQSALREMF